MERPGDDQNNPEYIDTILNKQGGKDMQNRQIKMDIETEDYFHCVSSCRNFIPLIDDEQIETGEVFCAHFMDNLPKDQYGYLRLKDCLKAEEVVT